MISEEELAQKKDYKEYLRSSGWIEKREEAIARAGGRCQLCNNPSQLQVHHRTYERVGEELPQDLVVLCGGCHYWFHKARFGPQEESKAELKRLEKIYIARKGGDQNDRAEAFKPPVSEREPVPPPRPASKNLLRKKCDDLPKPAPPQPEVILQNKPHKKKHRKGPRQIQRRKPVPGSSPYFPRKVNGGNL